MGIRAQTSDVNPRHDGAVGDSSPILLPDSGILESKRRPGDGKSSLCSRKEDFKIGGQERRAGFEDRSTQARSAFPWRNTYCFQNQRLLGNRKPSVAAGASSSSENGSLLCSSGNGIQFHI